jgi:hypothetical protein
MIVDQVLPGLAATVINWAAAAQRQSTTIPAVLHPIAWSIYMSGMFRVSRFADVRGRVSTFLALKPAYFQVELGAIYD